MSGEQTLALGQSVTCADGPGGVVVALVVDPSRAAVTHLVVEPAHRSGLGRLVPADLVAIDDGDVQLRCSTDELAGFGRAEETELLPVYRGGFGYGGYGIGFPMGTGPLAGMAMAGPVVYDRVPPGEIAVHRGDPVEATDGPVGRVHGLVTDAEDHAVTHVLLEEGHLWGRKEVAIPVAAVHVAADGLHVALTKDEVGDLPPVS